LVDSPLTCANAVGVIQIKNVDFEVLRVLVVGT